MIKGDRGAMDEQQSDETLLSLSSYWIQGRQGEIWQNIECHRDPLRAVRHMQLLIINDRHDELRLILARASAVTGEVEYSHMASFEGGGAKTPDEGDFQDALDQTRPWDPDHAEAELPQMKLWPEEKNSGEQAPLMDLRDLHRKNMRAEIAGISLAEEDLPLPGEAAAPEGEPAAFGDPAADDQPFPEAEFIPQPDRWRSKPPLRHPDHPRQPASHQSPQNASPLQDSPAPTPAGAGRPPHRKGRARRFALYSGLVASAAALGLALAISHPDRSTRLVMDLNDRVQLMLPDPSLASLIRAGDLPAVQIALARGANPNMTDLDGMPVLMVAADRQAYPIMDSLIQAGADPHARLPDGSSILHQWAKAGDLGAVRRVLENGVPADSGRITEKCLSPLSTAIAHGRLRTSLALARGGASLDGLEGCAQGPMDLAASHPDIYDRLSALEAARQSSSTPPPPTEERQLLMVHDGRPVEAVEPAAGTQAAAVQAAPAGNEEMPAGSNILAAALDRLEQLPDTEDTAPPGEDGPQVALLPETSAPAAEPSLTPDVTPDVTRGAAPAGEPDISGLAIRPPERPEAPATSGEPLLDAGKLSDYIRNAIDRRDQASLRHLVRNWPGHVNRDEVKAFASDKWGSGMRPAVDYALIKGQFEAAKILMDAGFRPTGQLLHLALDNHADPKFATVTDFLLRAGADVNSPFNGMSPLMRAVVRADGGTVDRLLRAGADIAYQTDSGETVLDFAQKTGRAEILKQITIAYHEDRIRPVLFGLSWNDRLEDVKNRLRQCRSLAEGFTACKLDSPDWLPDSTVIAQFDDRQGGRLASIQVDSSLMNSPETAKARFDEVAQEIQERLPAAIPPHVTRQALEGPDFFTSLQPGSNAGAYFNYWSDQGKNLPVFIHLKLSGFDAGSGYYRVLIGNPFQAG